MIVVRKRESRKVVSIVTPKIEFLTPPIMEGVMGLLQRTYHGQITIICQNFRVVQVERRENFNPEELASDSLGLKDEGINLSEVQKRIVGALKGLEFGQVILVIKKGRLAQIERLQKERYADLQGVYGDGI
ncbi:MAG: YezD family protein [Deltaproteobacteria bacterium]|jgi:hypothetical protein|nr:YezD family protein [Deltaproteobacteria bacterium]